MCSMYKWTVKSSLLSSLSSVYSNSGYFIDGINCHICDNFHVWQVYQHTSPISAHWVIWAYGIFLAFEQFTYCQHIFCSSRVNKYFAVYWFLMDMCNNVGSIRRLHYKCSWTNVCSVAGLYFQGHMPVMWNMCILVLLGTLLIAVGSCEVLYRSSCLIPAHELISV